MTFLFAWTSRAQSSEYLPVAPCVALLASDSDIPFDLMGQAASVAGVGSHSAFVAPQSWIMPHSTPF